MNCFACGAKLDQLWEEDPTQFDGTHFTSHGNYGSGVFDPMDQRLLLKIHICDSCMRANSGRVQLVKVTKAETTYTYDSWDPEKGYE